MGNVLKISNFEILYCDCQNTEDTLINYIRDNEFKHLIFKLNNDEIMILENFKNIKSRISTNSVLSQSTTPPPLVVPLKELVNEHAYICKNKEFRKALISNYSILEMIRIMQTLLKTESLKFCYIFSDDDEFLKVLEDEGLKDYLLSEKLLNE
jgi:S-adenosylmethionine:tRNA-ribosyltransferase-isomerase (queuine synthetase)